MSGNFSVYCILKVTEPPVSLNRRQNGAYYCHVVVPIPEQLVVFCEGDWTEGEDYQITVTYKDDVIQLGNVSKNSSCLMWKRDGKTIPDSMSSESEKGLAKLVMEKSEGPPLLENMTQSTKGALKNSADDSTEENINTPERSGKKKRRGSLTKSDKTPNGPSAKKQKTEGSKLGTRVRTPKVEKKENKSTKTNSPAAEKEKSETKPTETPKTSSPVVEVTGRKKKPTVESPLEKKIKKESKVEVNNTDLKESKGKNNSKSEESEAKKGKKYIKIEETEVKKGKKDIKIEETEVKKGKKDIKIEETEVKKGKKDSKNDEIEVKKGKRDNKSEEIETKKGRRNSRKDGNKSPQSNNDKDSTTPSEVKPKRGLREKCKLDNTENKTSTSTVVDTNAEKCDKENIHFDSNVVKETSEKEKNDIKESLIRQVKNKLLMTNSKQKLATSKDLTTRADKPDSRWGHSFCFVNKNLTVLIGGQGEKQQLCKDGVWALDNETRRWRLLSVQTDSLKPEYRMGHTATYDPLVRCIYVFGGSKNTRWFHDVHMLDLDEWKWSLVKVNGKAPTRAYHSATLYRHELWIFGGVYPRPDPQPDGCSNDIHIFSPVMESWYSPIVKGEKPIPRSGHSATLIDDQLVIFGGWDAPISYSDLHVLDMSIVEWTQPSITGTPPSPRSWHASCALSGKRLLIHGGYNGDWALEDTHIFDLNQMNWTQILVENQPDARVGHKAVCMPYRHDYEEEDEVIVFGGGDNDGAYFNDLHSLYIPFDPATIV